MTLFGKLFKKKKAFTESSSYWEQRYAAGRTSGNGSYGKLAEFKARFINDFVAKNDIKSVGEFGCGDGNQLKLANYPSYVGYDVSKTAIKECIDSFLGDHTKNFLFADDYSGETYDLSLSLDVIYHLVEDEVFEQYMERLFSSSKRFVIIYSNNYEGTPGKTKPHVRWRKFSDWIKSHANEWKLIHVEKNQYPEESVSDFFVYERI